MARESCSPKPKASIETRALKGTLDFVCSILLSVILVVLNKMSLHIVCSIDEKDTALSNNGSKLM